LAVIRKHHSPLSGHVRVVFELPSCIWADRIYLVGDFNDWQANDIFLQQARSGVWQAALDLPLGKSYQFRYVIDGQWRTDSHADGLSDNSFGSQNSIVVAELPEGEPFETSGLIHETRPMRPFAAPAMAGRPSPKQLTHVAA
jgi:1,4-alpha-glucan branching enzyme